MDDTLPRTFDGTRLAAIANEPETRRSMGVGTDFIDLAPLVAHPANVALADERGGFLFVSLGGGSYELHTLLAEGSRGTAALKLVAAAFRYMFTETDCLEVKTRVPGNLAHVDLMARRAGFRELWTMTDAWPGPDGERVSLRLYVLTLEEWVQRDSTLAAEGVTFHAALEAAKATVPAATATHADDPVHDRAVGAACLMAKAGNADKAVATYNRWAALSGYQLIQRLPTAPVIDIGDAIITFRPHLEILKCR